MANELTLILTRVLAIVCAIFPTLFGVDADVKFLILIPDGMADFPVDSLGGRTPLAVANTPVMDSLAKQGVMGEFTPIPDGLPPGSDIGNLSLYGYDPRASFTGRAPLEAANQGIQLAPNEICFRCNLVTIENGTMRSFTAGHIDSEAGASIIDSLNKHFEHDENITFYPGVQYRHLCVIRADGEEHTAMVTVATEPPHNITDQSVAPYIPKAERVRAYMDEAATVVADLDENKKRVDAGKLPVTNIWLWGQGTAPTMQSYADRFGINGAVISAVDLVNGIGRCAGFEVIDVPGATGYIDTNYEGKVQAGLDALNRCDLAYIHLEAPDETAHEGRADLKVQAIEDFDARIAGPCAEFMAKRDDVRILIAPDHITAINTKTHAGGPVPFLVVGAGIPSLAQDFSFTEEGVRQSGILFDPGFTLVESFIRDAEFKANGKRS